MVFKTKNKWARLFWVGVVTLVVAIVILQLKKMITYFVKNPSVTSLNLHHPEEGIEFPSFTICPLIKLNWTRLSEKYPRMNQTLAEFATGSFFSAYSTALMHIHYFGPINQSTRIWEDLQDDFDNATGGDDIIDFMGNTTFLCRGQFLACWFENGVIFPCCKENEWFDVKQYLVHSGPCFEFKPKNELKQRLPGPVGGFGFVYWYPNNHILDSAFNAYTEHGIQLFTSPTEAMLEKNPTVIQVGTHAHISIAATKTRRMTTDQLGRATCVTKKLKYFAEYSYASCQVECLIDAMLDRCGCMGLSTYAAIPKDRFCSPQQAFVCFEAMAYNFTNLLSGCRRKNCTEACEYWSYNPSLTASRVFNPTIAESMQRYWRLPKDYPANMSLIIADIYFDDIQYTEVEQVPALTFESFVSNIGGAMGLWTGASIITWIHLLYFCISACCLHREERHLKKQKQKKEEQEEVFETAETTNPEQQQFNNHDVSNNNTTTTTLNPASKQNESTALQNGGGPHMILKNFRNPKSLGASIKNRRGNMDEREKKKKKQHQCQGANGQNGDLVAPEAERLLNSPPPPPVTATLHQNARAQFFAKLRNPTSDNNNKTQTGIEAEI